MADEKQIEYAPYTEEDSIERGLVVWANTWDGIPDEVLEASGLQPPVSIEPHLAAKKPGMMLGTIQAANIVSHYILGGHKGEYQFYLTYRIQPGTSSDKSLKANEVLNRFGDWARSNRPALEEGIHVLKVEPTVPAALLGVTESGDEDHQILMRMTYEVIENDITI